MDRVDTESAVIDECLFSRQCDNHTKSLPSNGYPFIYCCEGHDGKSSLDRHSEKGIYMCIYIYIYI